MWGEGIIHARFDIQFTTVDMAFFVNLYGSNL